MKKKIAGLLAGVISLQMLCVGASAEVIETEEGIRFKLKDGRYMSGWVTKDSKTYYFNKDGYALQGWYKINDETYYFDHNGVMADGLVTIGDKMRYFDGGKLLKKKFVNITVKDAEGNDVKKTYYVSSTGVVATGWRKLNNAYYHFDKYGVMNKGWTRIGNNYYYFTNEGKMVTDEVELGGKIYTFLPNGKYTGIKGEGEQQVVTAPILPEVEEPVTTTVVTTAPEPAVTKPVTTKPVTTKPAVTEAPATTTSVETTVTTAETEKDITADKINVILNKSTKCFHVDSDCVDAKAIEDGKKAVGLYNPADLAKQNFWACEKCASEYATIAPKPSTSGGTGSSSAVSTPQADMIIQMIETYSQSKLSTEGKNALIKYVNRKIDDCRENYKTVDAVWYLTFIDGAFKEVGVEFPEDKRSALITKLKQQTEEDFQTIYNELIK